MINRIFDKSFCGNVSLVADQYRSSKSIKDNLASQLMEKKESILKQAIDNHLSEWTLIDLEGRIRCEEFGGVLTVYYLDDEPILEMRREEGCVSMSQYSTKFNAEVRFKFL